MVTLDIPKTERIPLDRWEDGSIRVGGGRITLHVFMEAYALCGTAEGLVQRFPTIQPADVYAVLSYYNRHRDEVDAYLDEQRVIAATNRRASEVNWPSSGLKNKLVSRGAIETPSTRFRVCLAYFTISKSQALSFSIHRLPVP
jgi:uncharacterized protein (DUF433 family)